MKKEEKHHDLLNRLKIFKSFIFVFIIPFFMGCYPVPSASTSEKEQQESYIPLTLTQAQAAKIDSPLFAALLKYEERFKSRPDQAFEEFYFNENTISYCKNGVWVCLRITIGNDSAAVLRILEAVNSNIDAVIRHDTTFLISCFAKPSLIRTLTSNDNVLKIKCFSYAQQSDVPYKPGPRRLLE